VSGHVEALLSAFLDGELAPADRAAVEAHLAECPACASHLAELAALDAAARAVPVKAPDGYFEAFPGRVRRTLEGRKARSWSPPHWGWAVAAAAILAVVTPLTLHEVGRSVPAPATAPTVAPSAAAPQQVPAAEPTSAPMEQVLGLEKEGRGDDEALSREALLQASVAPKEGTDGGAPSPSHQKQERADRAGPAATPVPQPRQPAPAAKAAFAAAPPPAASSETTASDTEAGRAETDAIGETTARERRATQELGEPEGARPGAGVAGEVAPAARLAEEAPATSRDAKEARRQRERWRRRAEAARDPLQADAAWVRVIELGAAAWRLGNDPDDLKALRQDAEAYLARPDARQTARVRKILAEAED